MELFVVNRYYGDETSTKFLLNEHSIHHNLEDTEEKNEIDRDKVKKKKKKNHDNISLTYSEEFYDSQICDNNSTISQPKKKKKHSLESIDKVIEHCELIKENSETLGNSENGRVKSKKRKSDKTSVTNNIEVETPTDKKERKSKRKKEDFVVDVINSASEMPNIDGQTIADKVSFEKKRKRKSEKTTSDNKELYNVKECLTKVGDTNEAIDIHTDSTKNKKRKSDRHRTEINEFNSNENETPVSNRKKKSIQREETNRISEIVSVNEKNNSSAESTKKKRKSEKRSTEKSDALDISYEKNFENEEQDLSLVSKKKKRKKSEKLSNEEMNTETECCSERATSFKKKKNDILNDDSFFKKKKTQESIDTDVKRTKSKNDVVQNDINNIKQSDLRNNKEQSCLEASTNEGGKARKKRFRQRSSYKYKPVKTETILPSVVDNKSDKNSNAQENGVEMKNADKTDERSEDDEKLEEDDKVKENDLGGFQVIGNLEFQKKKKVQRVLPEWLAKPTIISVNLKDLNKTVDDLEALDSYFKKLLKKNKVTHFFPVQSELVPFLIKQHARRSPFWPRDICVSAPTGSGKTLAFVLPIVQLLQHRIVPAIRALVVLPTQDLAAQVYTVFRSYVKGTRLKVVLTVGSTPIEEEKTKLVTKNHLNKNVSVVDIVITTPGRLVDHITHTDGFDLSSLRFLVVDEADRMIDNNDCNWLMHINKYINYQGMNSVPPLMLHTFTTYPNRPQRLLFSATLSNDPEKLHPLCLFQPKLFTSVVVKDTEVGEHSEIQSTENQTGSFVGKFTTPNELKEKITTCSSDVKPLVLYHLIKKHSMKGILCFLNSIQGAHRLSKLLFHIDNVANEQKNDTSNKLNIAEVYSDLKFEQRNQIIQDFRKKKIDLVVASDNLARGIDIENIDYVINYEAPDNVKKYIHRVGRTARGGREGTSVTFVTTAQRSTFLRMLSNVGKNNIEDLNYIEEDLKNLEEIYTKALDLLRKDVKREGDMTLEIAKALRRGKKIKNKSGKLVLDGTTQNRNIKKSKNHLKQLKKKQETRTNKNNNKLKNKENIKSFGGKEKSEPNQIGKKTKVENIIVISKNEKNVKDKTHEKDDASKTGRKQNKKNVSAKRKEIKKVVNKVKGKSQSNKLGKKNKKNVSVVGKPNGSAIISKSMKRNLKVKLKKKLKKQQRSQDKKQ